MEVTSRTLPEKSIHLQIGKNGRNAGLELVVPLTGDPPYCRPPQQEKKANDQEKSQHRFFRFSFHN